MTTFTPEVPKATENRAPWLGNLHPQYRLILRWLFIAATAVVGFHASLASALTTVQHGGINSYLVVVPLACALAGIGVALRKPNELPIHDRETDVIVGIMGLVLALLLDTVLLPRYAQYFHLLRLDLVALWFFLISSAIVLFGLRPVHRFQWVWILALAVFPLPYQIATILLGGTRTAAGGAALIIAAVATAIAVGRATRAAFLGSIASLAVGLTVLAVMHFLTPRAPLVAFQAIPAVASIVVVAGIIYVYLRRGRPKLSLDRKVEPLAASHVWAGLPLVLVVAVALSFVNLPGYGNAPRSDFDVVNFANTIVAPPGWHITNVDEYHWVSRLYGPGAVLNRTKLVADTGNPDWDKFARPRGVVVDTVTTTRPFAFQAYPAKVLYHVATFRESAPVQVDLGHGVTGTLVTAVDDKILITWNALTWTWGNDHIAQQVTVFAVDNHEPDAPFPEPTGALIPTLNSLFTVLFRGNSAVTDESPSFKDGTMVTEFSRALVNTELKHAGLA
ncbi:hypothetical protein ACTXG7_14220 [Mycolicibacterium sp. Dal123E01]|uniref:hypothetical protein n=1 Tax=Mycolicibacterium sp. Dal123E01 TaxID=3457578 RepID=UPI00403EAA42